jgi:hypothetical protein
VISIREATFKDFALFELHENNIEEIKVSSGIEPGLCMAALYETSEQKQIVLLDDKPICISGLVDNHNLWLFFSADIENMPLSFFKETRKGLNNLLNKCDYIEGYIYSENAFALQWAKFMKITIDDPKEYGVENKLFHYFFKRKEA